MAENSKISWTHHTFNPWVGCTKVSPACDHCYAENLMDTRMHVVRWGAGQPRKRTSEANWRMPLKWDKQAAAEGTRHRVFCASLADVFDNEVPEHWRWDLFRLISSTPNLDWLLLTKRIGNAHRMLNAAAAAVAGDGISATGWDRRVWPNVWLGATVCNQVEADRDIPKLLATSAAKRFLSMEPLLGQVDLSPWLQGNPPTAEQVAHANPLAWRHVRYGAPQLDWVIVGGESGAHARPMHPDWARKLRDDCTASGVPFHLKQWGEWHSATVNLSTGERVFRQFPDYQTWVSKARTWVGEGICLDRLGNVMHTGGDMKAAQDEGRFPVTVMHRLGVKNAGRILDGRQWDEVPTC